jgi:ABC-type glycerol-3-phosphate transport system permease component
MNPLRGFLLGLVVVGVVLAIFSRRIARGYAQLVSLLLVATIILMPFAWLVCAAFKDKSVLNEHMFLPPPGKLSSQTINLDNFRTLFTPQQSPQGPVSFWRHIVNSVFLASAGTVLSMFFSSMGGYALSKFRFRGRNAILTVMLASLTVPAVALLAPNLQVISMLGWMDTYKALLVPASVSVFGIFLYRQAMLSVPNDLIEAGRIDGCGEFRIYLQLIMPLVRPMTGAFCLITFLGMWNSFLGPNVFLQTQSKLPLPVVLNQYIGVYTSQYGVFLAGTLLAIIPPAVLFLALQREFISGLTTGAVKQ